MWWILSIILFIVGMMEMRYPLLIMSAVFALIDVIRDWRVSMRTVKHIHELHQDTLTGLCASNDDYTTMKEGWDHGND